MEWLEYAVDYKFKNTITYAKLCEIVNNKFELQLNENTFRKEVSHKLQDRLNVAEGFTVEIKDDEQKSSGTLEMSLEQAKDKDYLLIAHGYDPNHWELKKANSRIVEKLGKRTFCSSIIHAVPKEETFTTIDFIDEIQKIKPLELKKYVYDRKEGGHLLEPCLYDLHIGKLAWEAETGANFDHKIAQEICTKAVDDIIGDVKFYDIERTLLAIGNDLFNFDDTEGNTRHGTRQDNDVRWQKMFCVGLELMISVIEKFRKVSPVDLVYVSGNHDTSTSFYLIKALEMKYGACEDVTVDAGPQKRKYYEFGNTLIGLSHGETEKKRIYELMSIEAPEAWGRTKYREMHMGHLHSEHVEETHGIKFRRIPSLTSNDAWHAESGYVGSIRCMQSFLFSRTNGLKQIFYYNET